MLMRVSEHHNSEKRCTGGLGHLLSIQQQVAVATHAARPLLRLVLPDGCVVVQGETEVVVDQVLA